MKIDKANRLFILLHCIVSAVFVTISFIYDIKYGFISLIFSFIYVFIVFIREFYFKYQLKRITIEVEKAIHRARKLNLSEYSEGDFSVLVNQISKMIRVISESEDKLKSEKKILADSIADISHQIRTPLTSVNLITSFLADQNTDEKTREENISKLRIQFKKIDWLVNALLKISKLEADTAGIVCVQTPLESLIEKSVESLLVPIELKNIELKTDAKGNANIDLLWTAEAITNIIKNCMEHTPFGGVISINAFENALFSEITIKDNGTGIAKGDLPHIFDRFYKGRNSSETSIGIGLSMSRMIITRQSGTITASNNAEGGAEFNIKFYKSVV